MLDISDSKIQALCVGYVGNQSKGESIVLPDACQSFEGVPEEVLLKYFLRPFLKIEERHEFFHREDIEIHEARKYLLEVQASQADEDFIISSQKVLNLLYRATKHPNILSGEVILSKIKGIKNTAGENVYVLGVFKSESKDFFINVDQSKSYSLDVSKGINSEKLDKGALVIFDGDSIEVAVYNHRKEDSLYWNDAFLGVTPVVNDSVKTKKVVDTFIRLSKNSLKDDVDDQERLRIGEKIVEYFDEESLFDKAGFYEHVKPPQSFIDDFEKVIDANDDYDFTSFNIDKDKVKSINSRFNKIIKLDTKVELKIDLESGGSDKRIEKGFDKDKQMYFYKVYFNKEV